MVITDELFGAFLRCETKAYLLSGVDDATPTSHAVSEWQQQINEEFIRQCRDLLIVENTASYFIGTPHIRDFRRAQYLFVIGPTVRFADLESRMHALEMASTRTPKHANHYIPIRFIPSERSPDITGFN